MKRPALFIAAALVLTGCGDDAQPDASDHEAGPGTRLPQGDLPLQAADFPALASKNCVDVVEFYLEAIGGREWDKAALVWDDPVIDGARLEALYGDYKVFNMEWPEPFVEGAAGSSFCTVSGKLTDGGDPEKILREGTLLLRRVNDVPGATPDQLRWTLQSSTFIENLARSARGEP